GNLPVPARLRLHPTFLRIECRGDPDSSCVQVESLGPPLKRRYLAPTESRREREGHCGSNLIATIRIRRHLEPVALLGSQEPGGPPFRGGRPDPDAEIAREELEIDLATQGHANCLPCENSCRGADIDGDLLDHALDVAAAQRRKGDGTDPRQDV